MRRVLFALLVVLALGSASCAVADTLFGTKHHADGTVTTDGSGGIVGGLANALGFGWVTTLLGIGTTAYATYKGKGWKEAAKTTVDGIESWKEDPANKKAWETLKPILEKNHAAAHVVPLIEKALS